MKARIAKALTASRLKGAIRSVLVDALDKRRVEAVFNQELHGFSIGDWVYRKSDGDWALADRDSATTHTRGMVSYVNGDEFAVCMGGEVRNNGFSFAENAVHYLSGTAGTITENKPSFGYIQEVGWSTASDTFYVNVQRAYIDEDAAFPVGAIMQTLDNNAPTGWLFLNGETIGNTSSGADHAGDEFQDLFEVIKDVSPNAGTEGFANGDTVTLPDMAKAMPVGFDDAGVPDADFDTLGETGGEKDVTLTTAEMPVHSHSISGTDHSHGLLDDGNILAAGGDHPLIGTGANSGNYNTESASSGGSISNAGSGNAHNNMPPYLVVNFIVKF